MTHKDFLQKALSISIENIDIGAGPFGALILKKRKIISLPDSFTPFEKWGTFNTSILY